MYITFDSEAKIVILSINNSSVISRRWLVWKMVVFLFGEYTGSCLDLHEYKIG